MPAISARRFGAGFGTSVLALLLVAAAPAIGATQTEETARSFDHEPVKVPDWLVTITAPGAWYTMFERLVSIGDPLDCSKLDFETEWDGTPLVNGQDVSSPDEFGILVRIDGWGPNHGAAIFDSTPAGPNASGPDPDLLVDLGNVLIVQDHAFGQQTVPGIFDLPNDAIAGGTLVLDFVSSLAPQSVVLVDLDPAPGNQDALVTLIDGSGRGRDYLCPSGWTRDVSVQGPPGYRTLDLTTLAAQPGFQSTATASEDAGFDQTDVVRMEVFFTSSGALDDLVFCPD